jgi:hypothetical protein
MRIRRQLARGIGALLLAGGCCWPLIEATAQESRLDAAFADLPGDPQALADTVLEDVAAIRGLEFHGKIAVRPQTRSEFKDYVDAEISRSLPPERAAAFGRVVRELGLYTGPVIEDAVALYERLATTQVAAYYDPDTSTFYVLLQDAPMSMLAPVYAHELYHGLQDQYFDLDAYLLDVIDLNDDELLARQSVVEGEATYVMNLWTLQETLGRPPSRLAAGAMVLAESVLTAGPLSDLVLSGAISGDAGGDLQAAAEAMKDIPDFMIDSMLGVYIKGMVFVHAVIGPEWQGADRLYSNPPRSTEQILHPEKWLDGDEPVTIDLPDPAGEPALADWTLLDSNVIGEFQWRSIFKEFDMNAVATASAAGWDGDRYAVFERDGELLLLLYTRWDSEAEADEFAAAYGALLQRKYPDGAESTTVDVRGNDVLIVEGGDPERAPDYLAVLARASLHD